MKLKFTTTPVQGGWWITGSTDTQVGIVTGNLTLLPGSTSIYVSHGLWIYAASRGKGLSKQYDKYIKQLALAYNASAIICSVKQDNHIQHKRLTSLGWTRLSNAIWMWKETT